MNGIGIGTWTVGEEVSRRAYEMEAIKNGINHGITVIDTAEMYGEGKAEKLVGETIKDCNRSDLYLVSKVYPHNAGRKNIFKSCDDSLARLKTDYLDLYLLHWRGRVPLAETVECMEELKASGKIRNWGVSNFDTSDMKELFSIPNGDKCIANQVLYHVASRGIEYDLLPWMKTHKVELMAYCPLAQGGSLSHKVRDNHILKTIAKEHGCSVQNVMLAFVLRQENAIAIPKASSSAHMLDNLKALDLKLSEEEWRMIDKEFPAPARKEPLDVV